MSKNLLVGSVGLVLLSGFIMGVNLDRENKELNRLVNEQEEIIKYNQQDINTYLETIDTLNLKVNEKEGIIKEKDLHIKELDEIIQGKDKDIEKLKKQQSLSADVEGGKRQLTMEVTAYISSCPGCSGITYSGYSVKNTIHYQGLRVIAANFNKLPLYSIVRIDTDTNSFKAIVLDTGGAIRNSNTIDLLVSSYEEALNFGRQSGTITVLRKGKG